MDDAKDKQQVQAIVPEREQDIKNDLPGPNVLLMGPTGTGKTHSIGTLVDCDIEVFYFAFESGTESLIGYWKDRGLPVPANLHIITVKSASAGWADMADSIGFVNKLPYDALKKMSDPKKSKYNQLEKFLRAFNDVTDDLGNHYGCLDDFGPDKAVVFDGLTGLSAASMQTVVGGKADRDQKDWGLAQNILEMLLRKVCDDSRYTFVLLAHVERETDEVLGGVKLMVSTLGRKLPPKLSPMFSDAILTVRTGTEWYWDTASAQADVKTRNLPIANKNKPDFKTIISTWEKRRRS